MRCSQCGKDWPETYNGCPECVIPFNVNDTPLPSAATKQTTASGERGVGIGGNVQGSNIYTGDVTIQQLASSNQPATPPTPSPATSPTSLMTTRGCNCKASAPPLGW